MEDKDFLYAYHLVATAMDGSEGIYFYSCIILKNNVEINIKVTLN